MLYKEHLLYSVYQFNVNFIQKIPQKKHTQKNDQISEHLMTQ